MRDRAKGRGTNEVRWVGHVRKLWCERGTFKPRECACVRATLMTRLNTGGRGCEECTAHVVEAAGVSHTTRCNGHEMGTGVGRR
jgi:hypothetical protein